MKKIKIRVFVTITSIFFASTTFIGFFTYESEMNQVEESIKDMAKNESMLFHNILSTDAEGLARAHVGLTRLETLSKPFAERNREELLAASASIFKELRQSNNITHMYFIEPDGTVFLRVHKPEEYGDKLTRATFRKAAETKKTASGLEMGANFFSLRCVRPVVYKEKMIGFMEVAEEIDHVFSQMKSITGNDVSLLLEDKFLEKYHMHFRNEKVGAFTMMYPTNKNVSLLLARKLSGAMQQALKQAAVPIVDLNGAKYAAGMGPIRDAFGTTAGILLSQRDVSSLYSDMWNGIIATTSVFVAIFLASTSLFYLSLRKSYALFNDLKQHIVAVTKTSDLSRQLEVSTNDEVGELADEFNLMKEEIKKLNERLAARAADLEDANLELEAFNYTVAHDLRQPLNVIGLNCQAIDMLCGELLTEECKGYVKESYEGTLRMNRLIEALLNFSGMAHAELNRYRVDLSSMAKEVVEELKGGEVARLVTFRIADGICADGDPSLLRVVMANLLGNAWKYTGMREKAVIEFGSTEIDGKLAYLVRDNGAGFDMTDADKLFTPFQRLSGADKCKGFGIGLATVERIVKRHGGKIWAEGEPDKGATFFFTLSAN